MSYRVFTISTLIIDSSFAVASIFAFKMYLRLLDQASTSTLGSSVFLPCHLIVLDSYLESLGAAAIVMLLASLIAFILSAAKRRNVVLQVIAPASLVALGIGLYVGQLLLNQEISGSQTCQSRDIYLRFPMRP